MELTPILKWPGGKTSELPIIQKHIPKFDKFYEPFVGGGAVYFSINSNQPMFINDKSEELIKLYKAISSQDKIFHHMLGEISHNWKLLEPIVENNAKIFRDIYTQYSSEKIGEQKLRDWVYEFVLSHSQEFNGMFNISFNINIENFIREINKNIWNKMRRMKDIEIIRGKLPAEDVTKNIEASLKSAFYLHFRHLYNNIQNYKINDGQASAIFFFIRNYAYSGMFRYNSRGEFNVPYGGIGYNRNNLSKKIRYLAEKPLIHHLEKTKIENLDFYDFFKKHSPQKNDFIFLDPPYDTEFSTYAQNTFDKTDQSRLADFVLGQCKAKWMIVIKDTPFIKNLYTQKGVNILPFDKNYLVSFKNRNDKKAQHLLIKNY